MHLSRKERLSYLFCATLFICSLMLSSSVASILAQVRSLEENNTSKQETKAWLSGDDNIKYKTEHIATTTANRDIFIMNGSTENITVKKGQEFTVSLESNPSTGYRWIPVFNAAFISMVSHSFQPGPKGQLGAPGTNIFKFKALNAGTDFVKMLYKRSWEPNFAKQKIFRINIL